MSRIVYVAKQNLKDRDTRTFEARSGKQQPPFKGFVVRMGSRYYAYKNLCQHLPITLDLKDNNFFSHDKKYLQCQMHGAMYEIETGKCIAGPCLGGQLIVLALEEEGEYLKITIPEEES